MSDMNPYPQNLGSKPAPAPNGFGVQLSHDSESTQTSAMHQKCSDAGGARLSDAIYKRNRWSSTSQRLDET
ncbi:hypothetical protein HJFPF1_04037 [Paramyrothecium foliicola]|nr:hypothetical protein HJFPF1_04037 [Paramyrothecium foliicola]